MKRSLIAASLAMAGTVLLAVPSAWAYPPAEETVIAATVKAELKGIFESPQAGAAACEAARSLIAAGAPKYLAMHVERCLGLVTPAGAHAERCAHYQSALAIWKASPAPIDLDDDDSGIVRAQFVREMKQDVAAGCNEADKPADTDPDRLLIAPKAGAVLTTQEGLSYALPDGFGVRSFDPDSGLANLRNPTTHMIIRVERSSLHSASTIALKFPEREILAPGVLLEWDYKEFLPGTGAYVLYGRITLPTAYVVLGVTTYGKSSPKGVDKATGLSVLHRIAQTVRVTGPRRCIGECGPGRLVTAR